MYFVDPSIICGPGRTQEEYDVDGTGNGIWFQNGADWSPENLIVAPLTEESAVAEVSHPLCTRARFPGLSSPKLIIAFLISASQHHLTYVLTYNVIKLPRFAKLCFRLVLIYVGLGEVKQTKLI